MRTGSSFLLVLLIPVALGATEPSAKARIDGVNFCEFASDNLIVYTTDKGELGVCSAKDLKKQRSRLCARSNICICGAADDIVVIQACSSAMGFSLKTLKKIFEIRVDDVILTSAVSPKKKLIALFDQSGTVTIYSIGDGKRVGGFVAGKPEYAQSWMRFAFTNEGEELYFFSALPTQGRPHNNSSQSRKNRESDSSLQQLA